MDRMMNYKVFYCASALACFWLSTSVVLAQDEDLTKTASGASTLTAEAMQWIEKAKSDDAEAQFVVSMMYRDGIGVQRIVDGALSDTGQDFKLCLLYLYLLRHFNPLCLYSHGISVSVLIRCLKHFSQHSRFSHQS